MFTASSNLANTATAMVGAVTMSAACLFVAVSPARAATAPSFQSQVEASIDSTLRYPGAMSPDARGVTTLAVSIGADGSVAKVDVVKSSGNGNFDREAVRTAKAVSYPAGESRTIAMVLGFNRPVAKAHADRAARLVAAYRSDARQLLAQNPSQPVG